MKRHRPSGIVAICPILLVLLALVALSQSALAAAPGPVEPKHEVKEVWKSSNVPPQSVWVFIVVDKNLSEEHAKVLIEKYRKLYEAATVLNISLMCDSQFATHRAIEDSSITDEAWYSHVLYDYMQGRGQTLLHTPSQPGNRAQGRACLPKK